MTSARPERDEHVLSSLREGIATEGLEMSFLSSIGHELAAHHPDLRFRGDGDLLPAQRSLVIIRDGDARLRESARFPSKRQTIVEAPYANHR